MKKVLITLVLISVAAIAAGGLKDVATRLRGDNYVDKLTDFSIDSDTRESYIDSLLKMFPDRPDVFLSERAYGYLKAGRFPKALELYRIIASREDTPQSRYLDALYWEAWCLQAMGRYAETLDTTLKIMSADKVDSLDYYNTESCFIASGVYSNLNNTKMAHHWLDEAARMVATLKCDEAHRNNAAYRVHIERAGVYVHERKATEALNEYRLAEQYHPDPYTMSLLMLDKAEMSEQLGHNEIAEDYLRRFIKLTPDNDLNRAYAISNLALLLVRSGRWNEGMMMARENIPYMQLRGIDGVRRMLYSIIAEGADSISDFETAYKALRRSVEIGDSIENEYGNVIARDAARNFENGVISMKAEKTHRAERRRLMIVTAALLLIVIGLVFTLRKLSAARRHARQARSEAFAANTELIDKNAALEKTIHEQESLHREIVSLTMHLAETGGVVDELRSLVADRDRRPADLVTEIRQLLKTKLTTVDCWEAFNLHFTRVHPTFMTTLCQRHPGLTPGELRMCAFIIMNLSAKDTARMLNRSPRSVESMKYRLHKKLGLGPGESHRGPSAHPPDRLRHPKRIADDSSSVGRI